MHNTIDLHKCGSKLMNKNTKSSRIHTAHKFADEMKETFEMGMMGELNYFLGIEVKQMKKWVFISQTKYAKDLVKIFGVDSGSTTGTPLNPNVKLGKGHLAKTID